MIAFVEPVPVDFPPRALAALAPLNYRYLLDGCIDIAMKRVLALKAFAVEWEVSRTRPGHEKRRAWARYHLDWIFEETDANRLSFRDLCEFSVHPELSDVAIARQRIVNWFSPEALADINREVPPAVRQSVASTWKSEECRIRVDRSHSRGGKKQGSAYPPDDTGDDWGN